MESKMFIPDSIELKKKKNNVFIFLTIYIKIY